MRTEQRLDEPAHLAELSNSRAQCADSMTQQLASGCHQHHTQLQGLRALATLMETTGSLGAGHVWTIYYPRTPVLAMQTLQSLQDKVISLPTAVLSWGTLWHKAQLSTWEFRQRPGRPALNAWLAPCLLEQSCLTSLSVSFSISPRWGGNLLPGALVKTSKNSWQKCFVNCYPYKRKQLRKFQLNFKTPNAQIQKLLAAYSQVFVPGPPDLPGIEFHRC